MLRSRAPLRAAVADSRGSLGAAPVAEAQILEVAGVGTGVAPADIRSSCCPGVSATHRCSV